MEVDTEPTIEEQPLKQQQEEYPVRGLQNGGHYLFEGQGDSVLDPKDDGEDPHPALKMFDELLEPIKYDPEAPYADANKTLVLQMHKSFQWVVNFGHPYTENYADLSDANRNDLVSIGDQIAALSDQLTMCTHNLSSCRYYNKYMDEVHQKCTQHMQLCMIYVLRCYFERSLVDTPVSSSEEELHRSQVILEIEDGLTKLTDLNRQHLAVLTVNNLKEWGACDMDTRTRHVGGQALIGSMLALQESIRKCPMDDQYCKIQAWLQCHHAVRRIIENLFFNDAAEEHRREYLLDPSKFDQEDAEVAEANRKMQEMLASKAMNENNAAVAVPITPEDAAAINKQQDAGMDATDTMKEAVARSKADALLPDPVKLTKNQKRRKARKKAARRQADTVEMFVAD